MLDHVPPEDAASLPLAVSEALSAALALLDDEEQAYFRLNVIEGKPRAECAAILGWGEVRTARVRRRLDLHLKKLRTASPAIVLPAPMAAEGPAMDDEGILERKRGGGYRATTTPARIYSFSRGSSLNPFYREKLTNGSSVWSLCDSEQTGFPILNISERPILKGTGMSTPSEERLKTEQAKLTRIAERLHAGRVSLEAAQADLNNARVELDGEMSASVLEDRLANTEGMQKKVQKLQTVLDSKRAELGAAEVAHRQQAGVVQGIEDQVKAGRRSKLISENRPLVARFVALMKESAQLATDIQLNLTEDGVDHFIVPTDLVTTGDHPDTAAALYRMLFTQARFMNELCMFNPRLRKELFIRYPNRMPENWRADVA